MGALSTLEEILYLVLGAVRQALADHCELETADDERTLVAGHGGLLSVWAVHGALGLIGPAEFERLVERVTLALQPYLARHWHSVQVVFARLPEATHGVLQEAVKPARRSAQQLGLDLEDVLEARVAALGRRCVHEEIYLTLWTHPSLFSRLERKAHDKARMALFKSRPPLKEAQNPDKVYGALREGHAAVCHAITQDLTAAGLAVEQLEVHRALGDIRRLVEPQRTARDWRPALPGDPLPLRVSARPTRDASMLFWPPLGQQLFPSDGEQDSDSSLIRIGNYLYGTVYVEVPPQYVQPFIQLFNRLDPASPWRIAFQLDGDGLQGLNFKAFMASILAFTHAGNRLIVRAIEDLKAQVRTGDTACRLRIAASTWAPRDEPALCRARLARLARSLESWGTCAVRVETGDPAAGALATLPAVTTQSIGEACAAPLREVVTLWPLARPASPWTEGAVLFRTPDGKPWPYQPGSSLQPGFVELILAPTGFGKSVLLHAINLGFLLSSERYIPYLGGIDIGGSSAGLVDLLREAAPPSRRHLFVYRRLRQQPEYAINPFDTQLGCRQPLPHEAAFLVNFLTLLATPLTRERPDDYAAEVASLVVQEVYRHFEDSPHGHPKRFTRGLDPAVEEALARHRLDPDEHTTWWEIVDRLFDAGDSLWAVRAQRYAVPTLEDAIALLKTATAVRTRWGDKLTDGEHLIDALYRQWSTAAGQFPLLARPTAFDVGPARVIFLDLEEVAPRGGPAADRATGIMYMLARQVVANVHFLHPDHVRDIPERYRSHHGARIQALRETPKRLLFDEFHRARRGGQSTLEQVRIDIREARKRGVQISLCSQLLEDFDAEILENSSSRFILGLGTEAAVHKAAATFQLSATDVQVLRQRLYGPTPAGAPFLFQFITNRGRFTQELLLTLGAEELWALSTVNEDAALRRRVCRQLPAVKARAALAHRFPSGTAKPEVERRRYELHRQGLLTAERKASVLDELAAEVLDQYRVNRPALAEARETA